MAQTSSTTTAAPAQSPATQKFIKQITNPFLQRLYLFGKLPAAFFMGVRLRSLTQERAEVTLPYGWRSQNPFKSIYFAAQAAAAEFSTGVLSSMAIHGKGKISMLVAGMEAKFVKKANKKATFICDQGAELEAVIQRALKTGEGQTITLKSIGTQPDENGQPVVISEFHFTWTFKVKK